jgi:hypothetical protein
MSVSFIPLLVLAPLWREGTRAGQRRSLIHPQGPAFWPPIPRGMLVERFQDCHRYLGQNEHVWQAGNPCLEALIYSAENGRNKAKIYGQAIEIGGF